MTEKTIDPIFAPSVLEHAMAMFDDVNFDALKAEPRLEGVVDKNPKTAAIILAGGSGERFGHEGGKQLVEIAGKPILTRSAEVFDAVGDVGLIVIVCPEERMSEYLSKAIDPFPFVTPIVMAPAGSIRQESAFSGLELVPEEYEFVCSTMAQGLLSPKSSSNTPSARSKAILIATAHWWGIPPSIR